MQHQNSKVYSNHSFSKGSPFLFTKTLTFIYQFSLPVGKNHYSIAHYTNLSVREITLGNPFANPFDLVFVLQVVPAHVEEFCIEGETNFRLRF